MSKEMCIFKIIFTNIWSNLKIYLNMFKIKGILKELCSHVQYRIYGGSYLLFSLQIWLQNFVQPNKITVRLIHFVHFFFWKTVRQFFQIVNMCIIICRKVELTNPTESKLVAREINSMIFPAQENKRTTLGGYFKYAFFRFFISYINSIWTNLYQ